jgi:hypothetical protein
MWSLTYFSEVIGELCLSALFAQIWVFPFLIYINVVDMTTINKWKSWVITSLLLSYPSGIFASSPASQDRTYVNVQPRRYRSVGSLETPMLFVLAPSPPRCITCSIKLAPSSLAIFTKIVCCPPLQGIGDGSPFWSICLFSSFSPSEKMTLLDTRLVTRFS